MAFHSGFSCLFLSNAIVLQIRATTPVPSLTLSALDIFWVSIPHWLSSILRLIVLWICVIWELHVERFKVKVMKRIPALSSETSPLLCFLLCQCCLSPFLLCRRLREGQVGPVPNHIFTVWSFLMTPAVSCWIDLWIYESMWVLRKLTVYLRARRNETERHNSSCGKDALFYFQVSFLSRGLMLPSHFFSLPTVAILWISIIKI